ncbi:unnamed protein product, partial [Staurois parvus]
MIPYCRGPHELSVRPCVGPLTSSLNIGFASNIFICISTIG